MSLNQMLVSTMLTTIGFCVFYYIPLAFKNETYVLAMIILSCMLNLIVIGLTFLTTLLYSMLEKVLLWVTLHTCCYRDKRLLKVVSCNM
jgi:hypothetical protein